MPNQWSVKLAIGIRGARVFDHPARLLAQPSAVPSAPFWPPCVGASSGMVRHRKYESRSASSTRTGHEARRAGKVST